MKRKKYSVRANGRKVIVEASNKRQARYLGGYQLGLRGYELKVGTLKGVGIKAKRMR